jgi:hypothetical protein
VPGAGEDRAVIKQSNRSSDGTLPLTHAGRGAHASPAPGAGFGDGGSPVAMRMSSAEIAPPATRAQRIETGQVPSGIPQPARRPAEDFTRGANVVPPLTLLGIALWLLGSAAIVLPTLTA